MATAWKLTAENQVATLCVITGVGVAFVLAPRDSYLFMFGNVAFFWLPQAIVLGILIPLSSRSAVVSGTAIVLALYLAAFGAWVFSSPRPDSMAWLGYIFSLPGAGVGALIGLFVVRRRNFSTAFTAGAISALCTLFGLIANQALICGTVMYCGF
jgi:hypothetical protein